MLLEKVDRGVTIARAEHRKTSTGKQFRHRLAQRFFIVPEKQRARPRLGFPVSIGDGGGALLRAGGSARKEDLKPGAVPRRAAQLDRARMSAHNSLHYRQ